MRFPALEPRRPREPIGPLVDIVFLLLVFFLLAGTLEPAPPFTVAPPVAESSEAPADGALRVALARDGRIAFEGRLVTPDELARAVDRRLAETQATPVLQIEADGAVATRDLLALLARLARTDASHLELVTLPREPNQ